MLVPIIEKANWTLLIGNLKNKVWDIYNSLPKKNHRAIIPEVVSNPEIYSIYPISTLKLEIHLKLTFESSWSDKLNVHQSRRIAMYVYKYMEVVIQLEAVIWGDVKDWQENMPKFRAEFA
ncbi:hypothetical protein IEQ34_007920 [Dendrobium chrysotoxum]|uniref:Uncharacterized protein n=1 Tax=Dendrobium chrysotoxum TaxID=161865 RepID=A0AAV7H745_DENCH|nr:hypothetical protein IEQ34_007920 [Dendrobium chrysotoxum]